MTSEVGKRPTYPTVPVVRDAVRPEDFNALGRVLMQFMRQVQQDFGNMPSIFVRGMIDDATEARPWQVFIRDGHLVVNVPNTAFIMGSSVTASMGTVTVTIT